MAGSFPPTIIVVHPREKRSKCTVESLRVREGFVFWTFPDRGPEPLGGYVRLAMEGPVISPTDATRGLLLLDGTWRLAERMEKFFRELTTRSLPAIQTAYPRMSRIKPDPTGGMATIEALYAAYRLMGRACDSLLDDYHWAQQFVAANEWAWPASTDPTT